MARRLLPGCGGPPEAGGITSNHLGIMVPCTVRNGSENKCNPSCDPLVMQNATQLLAAQTASSCLNSSQIRSTRLLGTLSLENVCVRYPRARSSLAELISRDGNCAAIYGYSEYRKGYSLLSLLRPPRPDQDLSKCRRSSLGLGVRFSSNNFFHQYFFAPAMHQALGNIARMAKDKTFVPLNAAFPQEAPTAQWEYTLRSLSNASADQLHNETFNLLNAPCTCFDRFIAATQGIAEASAATRAAVAAFRQSSSLNARIALHMAPRATRSVQDMLFIMRRGSRRVITNEAEVRLQVQEAQPRVRVLSFERLPVARQLALVSAASVLIGVHGMAIAGYIVHLPSDVRTTACVEIWPKPDRHSWEWARIVPSIAQALGVAHFHLEAPHAPGCYIDQLRSRNCSAEEQPTLCRAMVSKGLKSFAASSVLNCNVTVRPERLLPLIQRAAYITSRPSPEVRHTVEGRRLVNNAVGPRRANDRS